MSDHALPTYAAAEADAAPACERAVLPPPRYEFDVAVNVNVNLGIELAELTRYDTDVLRAYVLLQNMDDELRRRIRLQPISLLR